MYKDARQLLSDTKFYEGYSRFDKSLGRYETWNEAVDRVMNMHRDFYKEKMSPELEEMLDTATKNYKDKAVLGAQRSLQFGGEQLLRHHMRLYNCFDVETEFVTSKGIRSFKDFKENDTVSVLTHTGKWQNAKVKKYGKQMVNKVTMFRGSNEKNVVVTPNHRWILHDGTVTTSLKESDRLYKEPKTFGGFDWEKGDPLEKLYWCYGYVYGDGTVTGDHSMVRLCKKDVWLEDRFTSMGFSTSSSSSLMGDIMVYTGTYKKTLPDLEKDSPELIRAFVSGYLHADGVKNHQHKHTGKCKQYQGIQATGEESINFIRNAFPVAGVHIISEHDLTGQKTNYGVRPYTVRFVTCDSSGSKFNAGWKVKNIVPLGERDVWCLEVEEDSSFLLKGGIVTGNCVSGHADRPEFFGEYYYILLCGAGVGFSVQKQHIKKLPKIKQRNKQPKTHVVEDSIEGWATALDVLMSSYFVGGGKHPEYEGRRIYFDLSQIRPKGSPIANAFKAPGPDPLRKALDRIEYLLQGIVIDGESRKLKPIEIYDINMFVADSVLAGGVRRSATICLFSKDDNEMLKAKTGNWFQENPQRARSNNSVVIRRDELKKPEFMEMMENIKQYGEPGFFFVDDEDITCNPCVEIGMYPLLGKESGFQGCNLVEINGGSCTTEEKFYQACTTAAILGTLQAGYTDFKFVSETTRKIFEREALLGVSITGWMTNPKILFDEKILKKGAELVLKVNKKVAKMIGINPSARTTCVKPSGNASVLLKTTSGIHPDHSKMYIRNIQITKDNEVAQLMKKHNPYMVEDSVWSTSGNDYVISFPIVTKEGTLYKDDIYGVKHLEYVKKAQQNWVESGTDVDLCVNKNTRHNVSNTIMVDDWDEVSEYVFKNRKFFAGIAFISMSGDKDYNQAPNTKVKTHREIVREYGVGSMFASGMVVDSLKVFDNLWNACYVAVNDVEIDASEYAASMQADWVRRFKNYAENYFNGDMKKTEYCLKDVYSLHKWEKIQQNITDNFDWSNLSEKEYVDADTIGAASCVGVTENGEGSCLL